MLMKSELTETKAEVKMVGEGVPFERVRRITGYLVGTLDRFNNAIISCGNRMRPVP